MTRQERTERAPEWLAQLGLEVETLNGGHHLRFWCHGKRVDYWPARGKWAVDGIYQHRTGRKHVVAFITGGTASSKVPGVVKAFREAGFTVDVSNGGQHLIVRTGALRADYWPSTQRWRCEDGTEGLGQNSLVPHLKGRTKKHQGAR